MNTNNQTSTFTEIITHLSNTGGEYVDTHSGHTTKSTHFAVLAIAEERFVCPLPSAKCGSNWVTTLNPVTVNGNRLSLSMRALHTLNQKGGSVFDAALEFNQCYKSTGVQILDIFTVL